MKSMRAKTCILSLFLILSLFFISVHAAGKKPPGGVRVKQMVTVDRKPGKANFTTITAAVEAAPSDLSLATGYFVILIAKGVYAEYVYVSYAKKYVMMIGSGIGRTIITGNHSLSEAFDVYDSATFTTLGDGFVAKKISFRNIAGVNKDPAVAVLNSAEKSAFHLCSFEGYQSTLYAFSGTQFYKQCDIYGTVDTIFGNTAAFFQNCNIFPRVPRPGQFNTITAQHRNTAAETTGFIFQKCSFIGLQTPDYKTFLGRPSGWHSKVVIMQSYMESVIDPAGWAPWSKAVDAPERTLSYYAEYNNTGPGSVTSNRITWPGFHVIDTAQAKLFTVASFILGQLWLPTTGIPFTADLS